MVGCKFDMRWWTILHAHYMLCKAHLVQTPLRAWTGAPDQQHKMASECQCARALLSRNQNMVKW